jgi:N-formylglutamate deformylase
MSAAPPVWLRVRRGDAPLIVSIPHAGTQLVHVEEQVKSPWLARFDADWWVDRLYDFASDLDATIVSTAISRTVIDVNRDPSARSLYPGMATTELVPTTTFDGEPLYEPACTPTEAEQSLRRERYFAPYHAALQAEIARLKSSHRSIVLYDAHSIRSRVPRLFEGELPMFNIGTFDGRSCPAELTAAVQARCAEHSSSLVVNGRFKGGWITRTYGQPAQSVHALQMELACRAYMDEPSGALHDRNWPPSYSEHRAARVRDVLRDVLKRCLEFAQREGSGGR